MLKRAPTITGHAYDRAEERLRISRAGFAAWVGATWGRWIPVNASYLFARNVKVSADKLLFITPWAEGTGVAIVVSNDHAIITVMDYEERRYQVGMSIVRPEQDQPVDLSPAARALIRAIADGHATPDRSLRIAIGTALEGPAVDEALDAYAEGRIDFDGLLMVMRARHARRYQVLTSAIGA